MSRQLLSLLLLILCFVRLSYGQDEQATYLSAKQHLKVGSYNLAMQSFKQLSNPNAKHDFVEYASFYYGLAAYKNGDLGLARSMWLQVEKKYPTWKGIKETYYWLAQVYFEEGDYAKGISYALKSESNQQEALIYHYVSEIVDLQELKALNKKYPKHKIIAVALANFINKQPLSERDFKKLAQISAQFDLSQSAFGLPDIGNSIKKNTYKIAVLLPFKFEGLGDIKRISRNKFVMDIYQGILEAADTLNAIDTLIKIFPYDTKRSKEVTQSILRKEEMKSMDLIIGPLFPEPSKVVSDFCFENKINMINPITSNSKYIDNNPYSFLFKPSNETKALKMADYASATFTNKDAFIFFNDTEKDSIVAYTYKDAIIKKGFEVIQCLKVDAEKIAAAHEYLIALYEVALDEKQRDSLIQIDENLVKERKIEMKNNAPDSTLYYQEFFSIAADSIGHIFVSSSKPLHASSFISAIEIRPDTISLLANGSWMNYEMLTIDQMQRLAIKFANPEFIDFDKTSYQKFKSTIQRKYKKHPTLNNCIGYELMYYIGGMMKEYGIYFQKGAIQKGMVKGQIFGGIDYGISNSNQYLPITSFEDSELINIIEK